MRVICPTMRTFFSVSRLSNSRMSKLIHRLSCWQHAHGRSRVYPKKEEYQVQLEDYSRYLNRNIPD